MVWNRIAMGGIEGANIFGNRGIYQTVKRFSGREGKDKGSA